MSKLIWYFTGRLKIIVAGDYVERFINMCSHHQIEFWELKPCGHEYEMYILVSDFRKLGPYIKKTKSKVRIKEREGFPFFLHRNRKRGCFLLCTMLCMFLLYASTFYIWGIEFEGNLYCTEEVLLEELENEDILLGMRKEKVDCNKITSMLRKKFDNITWASAYIEGTKLMIHVKENNEQEYLAEESAPGKNIVAECDGTIIDIVTRVGTPMVHSGDEVKKGDILVSGMVDIMNDAGEVMESQMVSPEADIKAETILAYEEELLLSHNKKNYTEKKKRIFWLESSGHFLYLGSRKIPYKDYIIISEKKGSVAGINFGLKTVKEYVETKEKYSKKEYQNLLSTSFSKFCTDLEKKGVQILRNDVKIYAEPNRVIAKGTVTVWQEFGKKQ